tara:strand:- start:401 stop:1036 length:636 start_codon:yes stop_codon:yes gene_type:complete
MFDYNNWVLCDYTEEVIDNDNEFVHLNYKEENINIITPYYILNTDIKKILKYEYEPFMVDLFTSFSSYENIINQSYVDLIRSTSYINNRLIRSTETHKRILNKMDLYSLTQKEKYSMLMILTQAVLGIPYHFICGLYPDYHVGELNQTECGNRKVVNRIFIKNDIKKVKISKILRVFSINSESVDVTYKTLKLKLLVDISTGSLTFMARII